MAEKIISPGVFTKEIDQTLLPAAIADMGACVIGPTVKGPVLTPTIVTSYSEYQARFGDTFKSGSGYHQYLTSHTAKEYLKHADKLTVVRILAGSYSGASANVLTGSGNYYTGSATAGDAETGDNISFKIHTLSNGNILNNKDATSGDEVYAKATNAIDTIGLLADRYNDASFTISIPTSAGGLGGTAITFLLDASESTSGTGGANQIMIGTDDGITDAARAALIIKAINAVTDAKVNYATSGNGQAGYDIGVTAAQGDSDTQITLTVDNVGPSGNIVDALATASGVNIIGVTAFTGGTTDPVGQNGLLISGSSNNLRWEITSVNNRKGTFSVLIRQGNDTSKRKQILETWKSCNLDPNSTNYVAKVIGDQYITLQGSGTSNPYLKLNGDYPNASKYVRVEPIKFMVDYLDENGNVRINEASKSLPGLGSGSYAGSFSGGSNGDIVTGTESGLGGNLYENITTAANTQGFNLNAGQSGHTSYNDALNLLSNADEFDFNLILMPGIFDSIHTSIVTKAIDVAESRGDCFVLYDSVSHDTALTTVKTRVETRDSNYAANYWPWVQLPDTQLGINQWVPASVAVAGVYAFNDKVAHPWFAPAGLNRGTLDTVVQVERKLTHSNRDDLYSSNVNPIVTFPGQGTVIWGQKTTQKSPTALDRVNVRRLLIKIKKFIASTSRFLVFEQNTVATRNKFLNIVNPYMEQVQANSGLTAFRVVMDESNNTPDVVDRNILYGQIFVQPARTAEFIVLDFTVQPTGATFPE